MSSEEFDYGSDEDNTSAHEARSSNEIDDLLGTPGTTHRRLAKRGSPLAELDIRVTLQVVVAILLLSVAGVMAVRDVSARQTRDTAFRQMMEANSQRDYLHVIEAAEKFLTQMPLNGSRDVREENVVNLYSAAIVHWVAQQPGKLDTNVLARIARYRQLVKSQDN